MRADWPLSLKLLHVTLKRNLAVPSGQKEVLAAADYHRHAGLRCVNVVRCRLGPRAVYLHTVLIRRTFKQLVISGQ